MGDWLQDKCNEIQKAQQEHIQKSFGEDIEKARSGIYKPTKQNLKEGKAGQKYGQDKKDEFVGSGDYKTKKENLPAKLKDAKSVLTAKAWLENKYGKGFKGSQLTDEESDIFQDIKQKEKEGFYNYKS